MHDLPMGEISAGAQEMRGVDEAECANAVDAQ